MSQENVEIVRRGYEHWIAIGDPLPEVVHADFVWDMSTFRGWPERQTYPGIEGGREFMADWSEAWEDWEVDVEDYIDAGERVVTIVRQRGRSKATGVAVDMHFGQGGPSATDGRFGCRCTPAPRRPSKPPGCGSRPQAAPRWARLVSNRRPLREELAEAHRRRLRSGLRANSKNSVSNQ